MRYLYSFIVLFCFPFSSSADAFEVFFDVLEWKATETLDWLHTNNLNSSNFNVSFRSVPYNYQPGFRVGLSHVGDLDSKLYYTYYHINASDSASGNLTTSFFAGRLAQTFPAVFYQTGQADYTINYNMFDFGKHFDITDSVRLQPLIGIKGGTINQNFTTNFQGSFSAIENVINNFSGLGPKVEINSKIVFWRKNDYVYSLISNFGTAYLWAHLKFKD